MLISDLRAELEERVEALRVRLEPIERETYAVRLDGVRSEIGILEQSLDTTPRPPFDSHRAAVGAAVGLAKKIFFKGLRPLSRAFLQRQIRFNQNVVGSMRLLTNRVGELSDRLVDLHARLQVTEQDAARRASSELDEVSVRLAACESELAKLRKGT